jgi:hypothetical protein
MNNTRLRWSVVSTGVRWAVWVRWGSGERQRGVMGTACPLLTDGCLRMWTHPFQIFRRNQNIRFLKINIFLNQFWFTKKKNTESSHIPGILFSLLTFRLVWYICYSYWISSDLLSLTTLHNFPRCHSFFPAVLFMSQNPHCSQLSCLRCLRCKLLWLWQFPRLALFLMTGPLWGMLVRYFVGSPSIGILCFSYESGVVGLRHEDHRGKAPLSSHLVKGSYCGPYLSLLVLPVTLLR